VAAEGDAFQNFTRKLVEKEESSCRQFDNKSENCGKEIARSYIRLGQNINFFSNFKEGSGHRHLTKAVHRVGNKSNQYDRRVING